MNNRNFIGQFIAVVPPSTFKTLWYPKQLLLMFDTIAIDLGTNGMSIEDREIITRAMPEISHLTQSQMLTLLSGLMATNSIKPTPEELRHARETLSLKRVSPERFNAYLLRKKGIDAVPLSSQNISDDIDMVADRDAVIRLTISQFPAPNDETPWEYIEDFRRDKKARDKFWNLKKWMNKAGREGLKQFEVVDELGHLLNEYKQHMKLHDMKSDAGTLEVLVTTTAEVAESLVKFKWGTIAKSMFGIKKQKIELMEDELGVPGKEVAYIVDAWKKFS